MLGNFIEVSPTGCHVWRGSRFESGYGRVKAGGRTYRAHRMSWELCNGPIPDGLMVLHECDNPPCVRPDHLFLGTNEDNMADMAQKGRASKNLTRAYPDGEKHPNAKLTDEQAEEIRSRYDAGGTSQSRLADEYGVSQALVSKIIRRKIRTS